MLRVEYTAVALTAQRAKELLPTASFCFMWGATNDASANSFVQQKRPLVGNRN